MKRHVAWHPGNDARPHLAKALAAARRKRGILVAATLSRLGRRVSFVSNLMDEGTPFACTDAPDDEPFILRVKASFAEEEARKISTRTKAALAMAKERGVKLGNPQNLTLTREARLKGAKMGARIVQERAKAEAEAFWDATSARIALQGLAVRAIAQRIGVSPATVCLVLNGNQLP